jgi:hypothetical protein
MRIADTAFVIATISEAFRIKPHGRGSRAPGRHTRRKQRVAYGRATASPPERF